MSIDGDNPDHISWIFEKSQDRAAEFGIQGVTYRLTQGAIELLLWHGSLALIVITLEERKTPGV